MFSYLICFYFVFCLGLKCVCEAYADENTDCDEGKDLPDCDWFVSHVTMILLVLNQMKFVSRNLRIFRKARPFVFPARFQWCIWFPLAMRMGCFAIYVPLVVFVKYHELEHLYTFMFDGADQYFHFSLFI